MSADTAMLRALAPNLDVHMYLPIVDAAAKKGDPSSALTADLEAARLQLLEQTSILDLIDQAYAAKPASDETAAVKKQLDQKRARLIKRHGDLIKASGAIITQFFKTEDEKLSLSITMRELMDQSRQGNLTRQSLLKNHKILDKNLAALYDLGFQLYEIGSYDQAAQVLRFYNAVQDKTDERKERSAQWGLLTCESVMSNWTAVARLISQLRDSQDSEHTPTHQRVWLLHASLYYYFKGNAHSTMLDHLFSPTDRDQSIAYCQTIQSAAPHLMRYVVAAMILNKKKKSIMRRVARMVESESYQYSDALTQFLDVLYNHSSFKEATALLPKVEQLANSDYLLSEVAKDLVAKARQVLFEDQLRIHRSMSIPTVAKQLSISDADAELWLVHLVREAKMDATVDSVQKTVNINPGSDRKTAWRSVMETLQFAERDN